MGRTKVMTDRQKSILAYIAGYIKDNGMSPTLRELQVAFHMKYVGGTMSALNRLVEYGYLGRRPIASRGMWVTVEGYGILSLQAPQTLEHRVQELTDQIENVVKSYQQADNALQTALCDVLEALGLRRHYLHMATEMGTDRRLHALAGKIRSGDVRVQGQVNGIAHERAVQPVTTDIELAACDVLRAIGLESAYLNTGGFGAADRLRKIAARIGAGTLTPAVKVRE